MRQLYITCLFIILTYVSLAGTASFDITYDDNTHCVPVTCNFSGQSTGGAVKSWLWYKDNVQFSNLQYSGTDFPQAGTYRIKLVIGFDDGTTATIEKVLSFTLFPKLNLNYKTRLIQQGVRQLTLNLKITQLPLLVRLQNTNGVSECHRQ